MTRILKSPFLPFLIFRNKEIVPIGIAALVISWLLFLILDLSYTPTLNSLIESGAYEIRDSKKGTETIGRFEWYLRATIGRVFYIFHWWIHVAIIFSFSTQHFLEVEAKENPGKEHHSKIVVGFLCIFPLAWYYSIFATFEWWMSLISFLM